jgi:hypothetical protein
MRRRQRKERARIVSLSESIRAVLRWKRRTWSIYEFVLIVTVLVLVCEEIHVSFWILVNLICWVSEVDFFR